MQVDWSNDDINFSRIEFQVVDSIVDESDWLLKGVVGFPVAADEEFIPGKEMLGNKSSHSYLI